MRLYNQYLKIFLKSKLLFVATIIGIAASFYSLIDMYLQWSQLTVNPLEVTLKLSKYVFVFFLVLSYEFFYKGRKNSLEETAAVTRLGQKGRHYLTQYLVMCSVTAFFAVLLILYNIVIFEIINKSNGRTNIGLDYIGHIIVCIIVYIFLVGILSINLGALLHKVGNRIAGYGLIIAAVFISSEYMERITNTLMDTMSIDIFKVKNFFDIFPINLRFIPNPAFGFSVLPYKIALTIFWITLSAAILVMVLKLPKKKLSAIVMAVVCLCSLTVYALPASKVIMDNSPDGSAMHDMFYYENRKDMKEEAVDFKITKYNLDFDIGRQLEATAKLELSNSDLDSYKFTLYHAYQIDSVKNQKGEELECTQKGDYFEVTRRDAPTEELIIEYGGAAKAYYSNYQGIYLSGDFQYYPVAGYKKLADPLGGMLIRQFLDEETDFDVTVDTAKKVFSNLDEVEEKHFVGKSNGLTLMAGMLTETRRGSNKIIWPTYEDYDEPGNDENTLQLLEENGYENCTFVVVPNMNQGGSFCHVSQRQIVSAIPFFSGEGFKQDWIDLLQEGKKGNS